MKKILSIILITIFSFLINTEYYNTYATDNYISLPNNNFLDTIEKIKLIDNELYSNVNKAYSLKFHNESSTEILNKIKYQIAKIDTLRSTLFKDSNSEDLNEDAKENSLKLFISLGFYKIAYQELQEYITDNDISNNFNSLFRISYDKLVAYDTLNRVEWQLKQNNFYTFSMTDIKNTSENPNEALLNIIENSKTIYKNLLTNGNLAYSTKYNKGDYSNLLNNITNEIAIIDNTNSELANIINNQKLTNRQRRTALIIQIGLNYYKLANENLKTYLIDTNTENSFSKLNNYFNSLYIGEYTLTDIESQIKLQL